MDRQYDINQSYQRPPQPIDRAVIDSLDDHKKFHKYLGNERYYHDYLLFFQVKIDKQGYESVINEYCLKGDERANDMLVRLHAGEVANSCFLMKRVDIPQGFLHPIIHLGFGVEFKQPAIIAEALAQAAVHDNWIGTVSRT